MKELGLARITTDSIIAFPKGTIVNIDELEIGDESVNCEEIDEDFLRENGTVYMAWISCGRDSTYEIDVSEDEFELIENTEQ